MPKIIREKYENGVLVERQTEGSNTTPWHWLTCRLKPSKRPPTRPASSSRAPGRRRRRGVGGDSRPGCGPPRGRIRPGCTRLGSGASFFGAGIAHPSPCPPRSASGQGLSRLPSRPRPGLVGCSGGKHLMCRPGGTAASGDCTLTQNVMQMASPIKHYRPFRAMIHRPEKASPIRLDYSDSSLSSCHPANPIRPRPCAAHSAVSPVLRPAPS